MIKNVPKDFILVKLEKKSENEYRFSSGLTIYIDTTFKPTLHQRIFADVVAIPSGLRPDGDLVKWDNDDPKRVDSIFPEVQVGDRIYFNYTALNNYAILEFEGSVYYRISYASVICSVRDKKIIPIAGNVLLDEYFGQDVIKDTINGHDVYLRKGNLGIITSYSVAPLKGFGIVRHVGAPLKDETVSVKQGDIIMYPQNFAFKNTIEDKEYLCVKYYDMTAIVGKENDYCVV
jgi:co-chaperonin GroES (HSP10)